MHPAGSRWRDKFRCRFCARIQSLQIPAWLSLLTTHAQIQILPSMGNLPFRRSVLFKTSAINQRTHRTQRAKQAISPMEEADLSTTNTHSGADSVVIKQEPHSAWGETHRQRGTDSRADLPFQRRHAQNYQPPHPDQESTMCGGSAMNRSLIKPGNMYGQQK
jgi:hypothetical protein